MQIQPTEPTRIRHCIWYYNITHRVLYYRDSSCKIKVVGFICDPRLRTLMMYRPRDMRESAHVNTIYYYIITPTDTCPRAIHIICHQLTTAPPPPNIPRGQISRSRRIAEKIFHYLPKCHYVLLRAAVRWPKRLRIVIIMVYWYLVGSVSRDRSSKGTWNVSPVQPWFPSDFFDTHIIYSNTFALIIIIEKISDSIFPKKFTIVYRHDRCTYGFPTTDLTRINILYIQVD